MKYLNIFLLLLCFNTYGQEWVTDANFDSKIKMIKQNLLLLSSGQNLMMIINLRIGIN